MATAMDGTGVFRRVPLVPATVLVLAVMVAASQTANTIHPFIPDVAAMIGVLAIVWLIPPRYRFVGGGVLFGAFLVNALVGHAVLPTFAAQYPNLPRMFASARLAGLIEPVTTKALPALVILWYYRDRSPELIQAIRTRPWLAGAILGWTFGVTEMLLKVPSQTSTYASATVVTPQIAIASLLHLATGTLAAGVIFRLYNEDSDAPRRMEILSGIAWGLLLVTAMVIHYWWNAGGLLFVYRTLGLT